MFVTWPDTVWVREPQLILNALLAQLSRRKAIWGTAGLRQWIVVFLSFCVANQGSSARNWSMLTIGALIGLLGVPAGLCGDELSLRFGMRATAMGVFLVSVLVNVLSGFAVMLRSVANMRGDVAGRPDEVRAPCQAVVEADGYSIEQWLPQDPGQAGLDRAQSYIRAMPYDRIECERMTGSKKARAHAVACQVNVGAVRILRAPWAPHRARVFSRLSAEGQ
jgi:hypothetical protein